MDDHDIESLTITPQFPEHTTARIFFMEPFEPRRKCGREHYRRYHKAIAREAMLKHATMLDPALMGYSDKGKHGLIQGSAGFDVFVVLPGFVEWHDKQYAHSLRDRLQGGDPSLQ